MLTAKLTLHNTPNALDSFSKCLGKFITCKKTGLSEIEVNINIIHKY